MPLDTTLPINSDIDDQAAAKVELKVEVIEEPRLQTTLLSATALPSLTTAPSSSAQQLTISTISTLYEVADISSYPPQFPIQLTVTTAEHEQSSLLTHAVPVATHTEKLLVNIFRAFTFLCFFSSVTLTQFTSVVVRSGVVVWIQAINGEIAQLMKKYYSNQLEEGEGTLLEEQEASEAAYPVLQSVVPDPEDREQEKKASDVANPILLSVVPDPEDKQPEMELIETTNIEAPHQPTKLVQLSGLPVIETEHTEPVVAALVGRKFAKAKKPTRAPMEGLELPETMFLFTSGKIPAVSARGN